MKRQNTKFKNDQLPKLYVIAIKPKENVVVVGERKQAERQEFNINNLILKDKNSLLNVFVRIRNTGELLSAKITLLDKDIWQVRLTKSEFGVSPGQSAVIYKKVKGNEYIILGGGIIQ